MYAAIDKCSRRLVGTRSLCKSFREFSWPISLLARAITARLEVANVESKLKMVALGSLPLYLRAQFALYKLLEADDRAAKDTSPQRSAFTFVDFTHKDLSPLWMSSEAVGCRTPRPGELEWDRNADTTWLGALGRAFKGAFEKTR